MYAHESALQTIIGEIHPRFRVQRCPDKHAMDNSGSKLKPDFITALDNQIFDFTVRKDMEAGYNSKAKKYANFGTDTEVISIVVNHKYQMYGPSMERLNKYLNMPVLLMKLAICLSISKIHKKDAYNTFCGNSHKQNK